MKLRKFYLTSFLMSNYHPFGFGYVFTMFAFMLNIFFLHCNSTAFNMFIQVKFLCGCKFTKTTFKFL